LTRIQRAREGCGLANGIEEDFAETRLTLSTRDAHIINRSYEGTMPRMLENYPCMRRAQKTMENNEMM
jgi:hypothetical protein